jgi:hypothetical protein
MRFGFARARVVGYGQFSLCVIHKEGLCPSSENINRLMMMLIMHIINIETFLLSDSIFKKLANSLGIHRA